MVAEKKSETLEQLVNSYLDNYYLDKALEKDGWDYKVRKVLGGNKHGDPYFYSEAGPDAVKHASEEEVERAAENLKKYVSYDDLIHKYSNEKLKEILTILPPLEKGNETLKKAHENFYKAKTKYEQGIELMKDNPDEFRRYVINSVKSEADAYYAGGRIESTRRVHEGDVILAKIYLDKAIDKVKPKA